MTDSENIKGWRNLYSDIVNKYSTEQRKNWYSDAAKNYNKTRPRYSQQLIDRVLELAQLPSDASILEVGCGPGIATTAFARSGFNLVCLEPSPEACQIARQNCLEYPNVEILNTTFEEWELGTKKFSAVLAATSFHWVAPEIAYLKTATALEDRGRLILLWNTGVQPHDRLYQLLSPVYQHLAPSLAEFHDRERATSSENLIAFGQNVIDSGYFQDLVFEQSVCEATYSIDDYLALLSTYSPYIALEAEKRAILFASLTEVLQENGEKMIQGSYLSAFHLAHKEMLPTRGGERGEGR